MRAVFVINLPVPDIVEAGVVTTEFAIVIPLLDDWAALERLLGEIAHIRPPSSVRFHVMVIDDGSSQRPPNGLAALPHGLIWSIEIVHLAVNLGHQRAIAVGLSLLAERSDIQAVLVMDADGEDRPSDIPTLITEAIRLPTFCVLARRAHRSETASFRLGYSLYKVAFKVLTGKQINFGNFCVLPMDAVKRLVRMPDLWNHLPAAIIRSRLPTTAIPIDRGKRYDGISRMNTASLILHGLSALSVYADLAFTRVFLAALGASAMTVVSMLAVVAIRFLSGLAIPGWTSTVFGDLVILLAISLVTILAITMITLASRSYRPIIPLTDAPSFIVDRTVLLSASTPPVPVSAE